MTQKDKSGQMGHDSRPSQHEERETHHGGEDPGSERSDQERRGHEVHGGIPEQHRPERGKAARGVAERGEQLSKSTLRARWIDSPEEHEEHAGETLATRDHEVVRTWAEERGAQPATVPGTEHGNRSGVLRLNFPGYGGQGLQPISWEDWFRSFDERNLVFVYQEHKSDGRTSNFFRLDSPEREDA